MHRMCALQGSLVGDAVLQRSVAVECLAWHPTLRVLAAGWRSGEIALYDDHTRSYSEQSSAHRAPVTCLLWSNSGRRMISCDKARMTCYDHCCTCVCIWCLHVRAHRHMHTQTVHTHLYVCMCLCEHVLRGHPTPPSRMDSLPCGPWTRGEGSMVSPPTTSGCRVPSPTASCILQRGAMGSAG